MSKNAKGMKCKSLRFRFKWHCKISNVKWVLASKKVRWKETSELQERLLWLGQFQVLLILFFKLLDKSKSMIKMRTVSKRILQLQYLSFQRWAILMKYLKTLLLHFLRQYSHHNSTKETQIWTLFDQREFNCTSCLGNQAHLHTSVMMFLSDHTGNSCCRSKTLQV